MYSNPYDQGIINNIKEEFFATEHEIYEKTIEFPSNELKYKKKYISLLPTKNK